ncbi:hypothetical protein C0993_012255 [Termitomyces sp. T159_Od127]|nr:hypothetical protein C0993_012255 [Termitomyces sp. T159_Od127]
MSAMDTDEVSVVLASTATSGLTLSLHPLPILNISEHLTRLKLQQNTHSPFGVFLIQPCNLKLTKFDKSLVGFWELRLVEK